MIDNTYLYEYTVESLKKALEKEVNDFSLTLEYMPNKPLFKIGDTKYLLLKMIDRFFWNAIYACMKDLLFNLMDNYGVSYTKGESVDFIIQTNGKKIGYDISFKQEFYFDKEKVLKEEIEQVIVLVLEGTVGDEYIIYEPNTVEYKKNHKGLIKNMPINCFFEKWFSEAEYQSFIQYIEIFNLEAEKIIGIRSTVAPTDKVMVQYRDKVLERLHQYSTD